MVNEYIISPHKAVRCTINYTSAKVWTTQLKVHKKLPGACVRRANDKDMDGRQDWDLKQEIMYLEEGIYE